MRYKSIFEIMGPVKLTLDNDTSETQGNSTLFIAADKLDMY